MASKGTDFQSIQAYGEYYLTKRIACGGMAELFRARRRSGVEGFEKILAVKRILPHLSKDGDFVSMFVKEAKIAAQLSHENIVQIFDFGKFQDSYFLAMEYVSGMSIQGIQEKIKENPFPPDLAIYAVSRASMGLDYAHRKKGPDNKTLGIVHRDISPPNILVSYEGEVKLVDFGIAKAAVHSSETKSGILKGKIPYMSPEQVTGGKVDGRSDIFSLGVVLHELLTGQRLFQGTSEFEMIEKVRSCQIAPPSSEKKTIPEELDKIVLKALQRNPEDRYQDAEEFCHALTGYLDSKRAYLGPSDLRKYMRELFGEEIRKEEAEIQKEAGLVRTYEKQRITEQIGGDQPVHGMMAGRLGRILTGGVARNLLRAGEIGVLSLAAYTLLTLSPLHAMLGGKDEKIRGESSVSVAVDQKTSLLQNAINEASTLLTRGDYEGAIARFDQVCSIDPLFAKQYNALFSRAFLARAEKNREESPSAALEDYRRACQMDPHNFKAHFEMGRLLTRMERYREAGLSYQKSIEANPDFPDSHFNLGYLYFRKKAYLLAAEEFENVVRLKPGYLKDAYFNLGLSYFKMGEKAKALRAFKEVLKFDPKNRRTMAFLKKLKKR
ncbi:MAG: protein kinase [Deltaproteobacteria bacterium]|nr:protein kinase [Deltaproteobacteria bacterium]